MLDWLTQALSVIDVGSETAVGYANAINTLIYVHTRYFMFINGVMVFIWNKLLIERRRFVFIFYHYV